MEKSDKYLHIFIVFVNLSDSALADFFHKKNFMEYHMMHWSYRITFMAQYLIIYFIPNEKI